MRFPEKANPKNVFFRCLKARSLLGTLAMALLFTGCATRSFLPKGNTQSTKKMKQDKNAEEWENIKRAERTADPHFWKSKRKTKAPKLTIRIVLLEDNEYNRKFKLPAPFEKVTTITIHNTANKASAIDERNYLNNRRDNVSISFHYAVDEKEAIQIMPLEIHGWHAGDGHGKGNMESIAIEICRSTHPDLKLYEKSEANAVILAAMLLKKYHLTTKDLRMHYNWSGKHCPHRILDANSWEDFKKRVAKAMKTLK